ncbi:MAG: YIP1 family protein [Anaerolineales bacterium]
MSTLEAPEDAPPPLPKRRGPLALLAGVLFWPRSTFAYLRDYGRRSWIWPVVLVAVLALAARLVAMPIERAQAEAALAAIQDQVKTDGGSTDFVTFGGPISGPVGALGSGAFGNPVVVALLPVGGVIWDWLFRGGLLLGLVWLLGGRPGFGAMLRMSGWTLVPNAARLIVSLAVMLIAHRVPTPGLTGLLNPTNAVVVNSDTAGNSTGDDTGGDAVRSAGDGQAVFVGSGGPATGPNFTNLLQGSLLSSLDLYTLWGLLLIAIGAAVTARLGWLKAGLSTLLYWAITLVLGVLPPLLLSGLLTLAGPGGGPLP